MGDVWLIAGQSNAAGYSEGIIDDPPEVGIHMFLAEDKRWKIATHPIGNGNGHSPFLHFAKSLKRQLHIPIGLVPLAIGGSSLHQWDPAEDSQFYRRLINTVGILKNNIKGLIWYQGCHEASLYDSPDSYSKRFCEFAKTLRKDIGKTDLPIIIAQLNKCTSSNGSKLDAGWSIVREQQRRIPEFLDHSAIVPTLDLSLSDGIHTSVEGNMILGRRFADTALGMVYGLKSEWKAPEITSAHMESDRLSVIVTLDHTCEGFSFISDDPKDFSVEDSKGMIPIEHILIVDEKSVKIEFERKAESDAFLHGAFGINPMCSLRRDTDKMPMLGFYRHRIINR